MKRKALALLLSASMVFTQAAMTISFAQDTRNEETSEIVEELDGSLQEGNDGGSSEGETEVKNDVNESNEAQNSGSDEGETGKTASGYTEEDPLELVEDKVPGSGEPETAEEADIEIEAIFEEIVSLIESGDEDGAVRAYNRLSNDEKEALEAYFDEFAGGTDEDYGVFCDTREPGPSQSVDADDIETKKTVTKVNDHGKKDTYKVTLETYAKEDSVSNVPCFIQKLIDMMMHGSRCAGSSVETVVRDVVTPYFKVDESTIKVYEAPYKGTKGPGKESEFGKREDITGKVNVVCSTDSKTNQKTVDVRGFDLASDKNAVSEKKNGCKTTYSGNELIVEFEITLEEAFLGGNHVPTNVIEQSGVIQGDKLIENFTETGYADADIKVPSIKDTELNIYFGTTLSKEDILSGWGSYTWEDDFIDVKITEVPGKCPSAEKDGDYSAEIKVEPTVKEGKCKGTKPLGTVKVNVFKPQITSTATDVWADFGMKADLSTWGIAPAGESAEAAVKWMHGTSEDTSVTMNTKRPELNVTGYGFKEAGKNDGSLKDSQYTVGEKDADFNVDSIKFTINDRPYTFNKGGSFNVVPAVQNEKHDFTVHTNSFDLELTKSGCETGYEEDFIFTVRDAAKKCDSFNVVISGNGTAKVSGFTAGKKYEVTEDQGWSWRYVPAWGGCAVIDHSYGISNEAPEKATVKTGVKNTLIYKMWFTSHDRIKNICKNRSITKITA